MKITDQEHIDWVKNSFDELNDGLIIFAGAGRVMINMEVYRADQHTLYEITIAKGSEAAQDDDTYLNHTYMQNVDIERQFDLDNAVAEYYDTEREAHARVMSLIAEHNHF